MSASRSANVRWAAGLALVAVASCGRTTTYGPPPELPGAVDGGGSLDAGGDAGADAGAAEPDWAGLRPGGAVVSVHTEDWASGTNQGTGIARLGPGNSFIVGLLQSEAAGLDVSVEARLQGVQAAPWGGGVSYVGCLDTPCAPVVEARVAADLSGGFWVAEGFGERLTTFVNNAPVTHDAGVTGGTLLHLSARASTVVCGRALGGTGQRLEPEDVAVSTGGLVLVSGRFTGTQDFGGASLTAGASVRGFVAAYDGLCVLRFALLLPELLDHTPVPIAPDEAGGFLVGATTRASVGPDGGVSSRAFVSRVRADQTTQWTRDLGDSAGEVRALAGGPDVVVVALGNARASWGWAGRTLTPSGAAPMVLLAMDGSGNPAWSLAGDLEPRAVSLGGEEFALAGDAVGAMSLAGHGYQTGVRSPLDFGAKGHLDGGLDWVKVARAVEPAGVRSGVADAVLLADGSLAIIGTTSTPMQWPTAPTPVGTAGRTLEYEVVLSP